jgi:16S rRNA (adenine(1408)-N(1))-methyltransferase
VTVHSGQLRVVRGKRLVPLEPGSLDRPRERVVVDVGTGDGRAAYRLARAHPDWLVVGVDPAWQRMVETATRSARKPARGGAGNLLLVCASIESAPPELHGIADEVLAMLPWGKLLRGIVLGEADVCRGLRGVARPGASLDVAVGTSIWREPVPLEIRDLPELTEAYARDVLAGRLLAHGWRLTDVARRPAVGAADQAADPADPAGPAGPARAPSSRAPSSWAPSSWARRLGSSPPEVFAYLRAEAC